MRTLQLSYSTATGKLSLVNDTVEGNINDNNIIRVTVTGLPSEYASAKIEYGVIIEDNVNGVYYPFTELSSGACQIPAQVCKAATSGRLPIGLKITYENQYVECSVNQIPIKLGVYTDAEQSVMDVFTEQVMMRGSSWDWLEEWTYEAGAIVWWDGQFWKSNEDGNQGNEPDPTSPYWSGIGEKGDTGNSLSADFDGNDLIITEKDHTGAVIDTDTYDMVGELGIDAQFEGTVLKVTTTDHDGNEEVTEQNLKGDSLRASFSGSVLTVEQVENDGTVVDTESKDLKGDSLEASFDGSVLTVKQVENDGTVVDTDSANLLGDGLKATFDGSVLTVEQFKNDGTVVDTDSADLLGNGLEASFSGTVLTVKEKKNDGTIVATTSQNLKGDSLEASFSGSVLTIDQINAEGQTVDTDSANLLGDSLHASFDGTVLTIDQVNNAGTVVDSDSQDLKGDSLEASFSGNTLTIEQVNAAGQTVDTDTYDMLGEIGISAEFSGTTLEVTTTDYEGNDTTASQDLKGDSLEASFNGSVLTIDQVRSDGTVVDTDSQDLLGNGLQATFDDTTLIVQEVKNDGTVVDTTSQNLKGDSLEASFSGTVLTVIQVDNAGDIIAMDSQNLQGPQGPAAESTTPGEFVIRYIGDDVHTEFDVEHNLGTTHPFWQVQDMTGTYPEYVQVSGYAKTGNILHLTFTTAPAVNGMAVLISSGMGTAHSKYEFTQSTAATTWTINHNLGRKTSFTVTDTSGNVLWCDEVIQDENTTVEYFGIATAGYAIER